MQLIANGLLTTYRASGKGKVVMLLHGWGDRAEGLSSVQAELSKQYSVIAPDLPGFGGTKAPPVAWGLDDYAQFLRTFLEKLDVRHIYAVIGHSNGGAIAVRGIGQGTLSAEKLVLLSSAGIRGEYRGRLRALRHAATFAKLLAKPLPQKTRQKLRRKAYKTIGSDMLVAEHLQLTFKKIVADDVREDARHIHIPTLLLYGEADEQTPLWYGEMFHELIENSTLEILSGAGHFLFTERPQVVNKTIREFLQ